MQQEAENLTAMTQALDVARAELARVEAEHAAVALRLSQTRATAKNLASRVFITANRITRADVEMSSGDGKPWFGDCYSFGRWMRTHHCSKLWAEWNGRIYHAADLMAKRMHETPGDVDHLPNAADHRRESDERSLHPSC